MWLLLGALEPWAVCTIAGICLSSGLAVLFTLRSREDRSVFLDIAILALSVAACGAALGVRWFGQLLVDIPIGLWLAHRRGIHWLRTLDNFAVTVGPGQAVGRVGCWLAGCCYGYPTSWGLAPPVSPPGVLPGTPVAPLPLVEGALDVAVSAIALWIVQRRSQTGEAAAAWAILHGLVRLVVDAWRADLEEISALGLTGTQVCAACLVGLGLVGRSVIARTSQQAA